MSAASRIAASAAARRAAASLADDELEVVLLLGVVEPASLKSAIPPQGAVAAAPAQASL